MPEEDQENDNTVYVGSKPAMSYVLAVVTQFSEGHETVKRKRGGEGISRAEEDGGILKERFFMELEEGGIAF